MIKFCLHPDPEQSFGVIDIFKQKSPRGGKYFLVRRYFDRSPWLACFDNDPISKHRTREAAEKACNRHADKNL